MIQITKDRDNYYIWLDDWIYTQRRFVSSAMDDPISSHEDIIIALCDKIMDEIKKL